MFLKVLWILVIVILILKEVRLYFVFKFFGFVIKIKVFRLFFWIGEYFWFKFVVEMWWEKGKCCLRGKYC